ncbi:hypothetical protein EB796_000195 [Bugula neritina]|uniref:Uncharacterized protein n=1 Tax=Bugula neritina TaxID=10212 RepID=A0A7J7KTV8_BUGNE|nr:hypothetical protein EB796_000195 [Bugula neritina]
MASRYGKYISQRGPKRIEGWLRVWDVNILDHDSSSIALNPLGAVPWSPHYCVLKTDEQTISHHKLQNEMTPVSPRSMTKNICTKEDFEKHYGIELPSTPTLTPSLNVSNRSRVRTKRRNTTTNSSLKSAKRDDTLSLQSHTTNTSQLTSSEPFSPSSAAPATPTSSHTVHMTRSNTIAVKTFKKPKSTRKEKKYICHKHRRKWSRSNSLPDNGVEVTTSWLCELKEGELPSAPPTPSLHCIQETKAKKSKRKQSAKPASRRRSSMSSPLSSHAVDPLCRDHGDIPANPYCTEYVRCGTQPALSGYKKVRDLDYPRQFRRTSYCVNQSNSSKTSESALTSKRRTSLPALMLGTQRMQSRHQDGLLLAGSASGSRVLRASSPDSQSSDYFYLYRGGSASTSSDCNTSTGYCSDLDGSSTITSPAGSELPSILAGDTLVTSSASDTFVTGPSVTLV